MSCLCPFCFSVGTMGKRLKEVSHVAADRVQGAGSQEALYSQLWNPCVMGIRVNPFSSLGLRVPIYKVKAVAVPGLNQKSQRADRVRIWGKGEENEQQRQKPLAWSLVLLALGKVTHSGPPRIATQNCPSFLAPTPIFSPGLLGKRISGKS